MVASRKKEIEPDVPAHVAVIMDGNGRWAQRCGLPRQAGHQAGIKPVRATVEHCADLGIRTLSLFAFSSENWQRPLEEVNVLMKLFVEALEREVAELDANGIRLRFIGDITALNAKLRSAIKAAEIRTRNNTRMDLVLAVAYGGRWDLTQATRKLAQKVAAGDLAPEAINEEMVHQALETAPLPGVDLLIRTGGEKRISNFLLWELAYSEIHFSDVLWPDFTMDELDRAVQFFITRQRRFGRTAEQVEALNC